MRGVYDWRAQWRTAPLLEKIGTALFIGLHVLVLLYAVLADLHDLLHRLP